jgi:hypothetical protein
MGYEYDFFVSYSRRNPVGTWVRNHFHPQLEEWLASFARTAPRVFIDRDIQEGEHWPSRLESALQRSKYLIAVWSPQYFSSSWCVAEWQSIRRRETLLGIGTPHAPLGLVCAVVFSDGKTFPSEAAATQHHDLSAWNYPMPEFRSTAKYLDFVDCMKQICEKLAAWVDEREAPGFDPGWPIVRPTPRRLPDAPLPRIE